jgi:hypothetical protein
MHQTFWSLLVQGFLPMFKLSLLPRIEDAVVAPLIPGLRDPLWERTISPDDYDHLDGGYQSTRPLRAVGIYGGVEMQTNPSLDGADAAQARDLGLIGYYRPKTAQSEKGVLLFQEPPSWLQNIRASQDSAADTVGILTNEPPKTAITGGGQNLKAKKDPGTIVVEAADMYNAWARTVYVEETLRGRNGSYHGALRWDIGPGSAVKILGSPERFIGENDALGQDQYGLVTRVAITLSAEQREASTSFQCAHLRTATENEQDQSSLDKHPLYTNLFTGLPLLDAWAFLGGGGADPLAEDTTAGAPPTSNVPDQLNVPNNVQIA